MCGWLLHYGKALSLRMGHLLSWTSTITYLGDRGDNNGMKSGDIDKLLVAAAFPHPVGMLECIETHISWGSGSSKP